MPGWTLRNLIGSSANRGFALDTSQRHSSSDLRHDVRRGPAVQGVRPRGRLESIDAVRGIAMILMLLDHLRETWLVLVPVPDPVDARTVLPALAIARFAASFCAPIFVALGV